MAPNFSRAGGMVKRQGLLGDLLGDGDSSSSSSAAATGRAQGGNGSGASSTASASSSSATQTASAGNGNDNDPLGGAVGSIVGGVTSAVNSILPGQTSTSSSSSTQPAATSSKTEATESSKSTTTTTSSSSQTPASTSKASSTTSLTTPTSTPTLNPTQDNEPQPQPIATTFTSQSDGVITIVTTTLPASSTTNTPNLASQTTGAKSFFNNKPLMGVVFGLGGAAALVVIIAILTLALRRSRRSRLERDAAEEVDWSAGAGVGASLDMNAGSGYKGMPVIGQLERSGTTAGAVSRSSSGRSNSSRRASSSTSPLGSEDGLLGNAFRSVTPDGLNMGMGNMGRRGSGGTEQQMGMAMGNAMPVSMGMGPNRTLSVSRQEGGAVNVPGQPFIPPAMPSNWNGQQHPYGPQPEQQQFNPLQRVQSRAQQRESIGAYAFQRTQQRPPRQGPNRYAAGAGYNAQPRPQQQGLSINIPQQGQTQVNSISAGQPSARKASLPGSPERRSDSPSDETDYYAGYNGAASGYRVANE